MLNIVVYAAKRYERASRMAAGETAKIFTCPPLTDTGLGDLPAALQKADLILFNLHGLPGGAAWFAERDGPPVAMRAAQLETLDLSRAVIFLENCYAGDENNPMRTALKEAGSRMIIAGPGENYGGVSVMRGSDWLFWAVRIALEVDPGRSVSHFVSAIKRFMGFIPTRAAQDTAGFTVWTPGDEELV